MACPSSILAGVDFLLHIEDGSPEPAYTMATATEIAINGELVDVTDKSQSGWRVSAPGSGVRSATITLSGNFTGSAQEETLQDHALANTCAEYHLIDSSGNRYDGPFIVTSYSKSGDATGSILFSATLESAGQVTVTHT